MAEIKQVQDQRVIDYMARDYDSLLASMRALIPSKMPEWTDHESEADVGNVLLQLFAHMGDILSYYQDRIANESFLGTAQTRRSIIHHLRLIGYRLTTAAPASTSLDIQFPSGFSGIVVIRRGFAFSTKSTLDAPSVRFEYNAEQDLEIDTTALPAGSNNLFSGLPVEEGRLISGELLGVSDGRPDQVYELGHRPLILRSLGAASRINRDLILVTTLGTEATSWELKDTLAFSRDNQNDFTVEIDSEDRAFVRFGNGVFGAVPRAGAEIRVDYRVGGGLIGNVPPRSIVTLADAPPLSLAGASVTNAAPATGGAERETIAHAVSQAPQVFRSLKRAVTAGDFKALALQVPGVGKVRAIPKNSTEVTLSVAPAGGGQVSDVLQANLLAYFEDKRMLSTRIEIEDVDYVPIYITAELGVISFYSPDAVREQVQQAVTSLLAFEAVDFAETLYLSKFFEAIESVDGVKFVNITEFRRSDSEQLFAGSGKLVMGANEIPVIPDADGFRAGLRVVQEQEEAG